MVNGEKPLFKGKIVWKVTIRLKTGLHIGGSESVYKLGEPDRPVIKDPKTREPYIPGSSVKGKIRSLLERAYFVTKDFAKERLEKGKTILNNEKWKNKWTNSQDAIYYAEGFIKELFGSPANRKSLPGRVQITDFYVKEWDDSHYEEKGENTIDRVTSQANPREVERVPKGTEFVGYIIYNAREGVNESEPNDKDLVEKLKEGLKLLSRDYLGGSGTRGYGLVEIEVNTHEIIPYGDGNKQYLEELAKSLDGRYSIEEGA